MADAMGGENFENDGEENGPMVGRKQETEEVVDDSKEKEDENTNMGNKREGTKEKEIIRKETAWKTAWKIIYQNITGLVTNVNKEKARFFYDHGCIEKIIIMKFTKTWLNSEIQKCPEIRGYRLFRGDRSHRKGGVAIYMKGEFEAQKIAEMSMG